MTRKKERERGCLGSHGIKEAVKEACFVNVKKAFVWIRKVKRCNLRSIMLQLALHFLAD